MKFNYKQPAKIIMEIKGIVYNSSMEHEEIKWEYVGCIKCEGIIEPISKGVPPVKIHSCECNKEG